MSTSTGSGYHHGDLRATLLASAIAMLESGEGFSLRAVAKKEGVSPTAPYRHFADRDALESAVAIEGFRDLREALIGTSGLPTDTEGLTELGVTYVAFALDRPAMFRLMFGNECDPADLARARAGEEVHELIKESLENVLPNANIEALTTALWGVAHGLAFLHLDGKLTADSPEVASERVRFAFEALFALRADDDPALLAAAEGA